jgi:phosphoglycolate phosphatase-like HAD superfamily hydrolase
MQAAVRAGVACIGVLSGGVSRGELESAGAATVFDNAANLLNSIDDTPIATLTTR